MKQVQTVNGRDLREMFAAATGWLEKSASEIDALNVFPVPDGDCGTNMLLTMRSVMEEASKVSGSGASQMAQAMTKGALLGARGNSGVILSQIWHGFASSLDEKEAIDGKDLANGLLQGAKRAYKALTNPVEGTMLTVIREAASAAQKEAESGTSNVAKILEVAVKTARASVAETPRLLPILRDAGVVDAGGQGLYTLLEGALLYLKGETKQMQTQKSQVIVSDRLVSAKPRRPTEKGAPFGYCTQFLMEGENLDPDRIREELKNKGQSLIVAGEGSTIRVHIHSLEPESIIRSASSLGKVRNVSITNMDEQHEDFLAMQRSQEMGMAIVAVVAGNGLADVFRSLGASAIVSGGQTMNPSTRDILRPVQAMPSDKVAILPNNKNVVPTARQVASLTHKSIRVVPTETIPQGVAALLAVDREADFETNAENMLQAIHTVKTIEITRATRATKLSGLDIKKNQAIGLLDGELLAAGDDINRVALDLLAKVALAKAEIITIYYGAETKAAEAEQMSAAIRQKYPELQIEVVKGDQPNYSYIVSVE
jgi:DAK2 domain fusion protein YloV